MYAGVTSKLTVTIQVFIPYYTYCIFFYKTGILILHFKIVAGYRNVPCICVFNLFHFNHSRIPVCWTPYDTVCVEYHVTVKLVIIGIYYTTKNAMVKRPDNFYKSLLINVKCVKNESHAQVR